MDVDRIRSYLQAACAGLGFDIGEVWWTSGPNGQGAVAAIGKNKQEIDDERRRTEIVLRPLPLVRLLWVDDDGVSGDLRGGMNRKLGGANRSTKALHEAASFAAC